MEVAGGEYDVVVVGGGLAALTAGLFAARTGRSTLVVGPGAPGGHLLNVDRIEDFPGFPEGVPGYELCPAVQEQAMSAGAEFRMGEARALSRDPDSGDWLVALEDSSVRTQAAIVATGSRLKELGVPGEERLRGKGVSHCATCDGPLFRGKTVGVVGGGDSALQEALTLASYASRVVLLHRGTELSAQGTYQTRVSESTGIEVRYNTVVEEVLGDEAVRGVRVREVATGTESEIELSGLFVYVGLVPNTDLLRDVVGLDEEGRVATDPWMRSEQPGLFAAGDVRQDSARQAVSSAGDGATAAIAAHNYLKEQGR